MSDSAPGMGSPGYSGHERLENGTMERELVHGLLDLSQQWPGGHQPSMTCSALHWCSLTLSSWGSSGYHNIKTPIRGHPKEAMRMGKGLEGKPYGITWFLQLEKRRLKGDLIVVFSILPRGSRGAGTNLFTLMSSDREWPEAEPLWEG